jgi:gluconolactonase
LEKVAVNSWMSTFRLTGDEISFCGQNLKRPECVVALSDGSVLASNRDALVTLITLDGSETVLGCGAGISNTFAWDDDGNTLVADFERGALLNVGMDGAARLLHNTFNSEALGAVNFVLAGEAPGTWWFSVSTRDADYRTAITKPRPDGRIYRLDANGLSVAASGLFFPNAMQIDPAGGFIYVAETTIGSISRAPIEASGRLGEFVRFGPSPLYPGAYTDGVALDEDGNVWITELSRNALMVIDRMGEMHTIFEDPGAKVLRSPTDLAFGGPDLRTVFVGSLKMSSLAFFEAPVAGLPQRHLRNATRPNFLRPGFV